MRGFYLENNGLLTPTLFLPAGREEERRKTGAVRGRCQRQTNRRFVCGVSLKFSEIRRPSTQNISRFSAAATINSRRRALGIFRFVNKKVKFHRRPQAIVEPVRPDANDERDLAAHLVRVKRFTRFPAVGPGKICSRFKPPAKTHAIKLHVPCPACQIYGGYVRVEPAGRVLLQSSFPSASRATDTPELTLTCFPGDSRSCSILLKIRRHTKLCQFVIATPAAEPRPASWQICRRRRAGPRRSRVKAEGVSNFPLFAFRFPLLI